MTRRRDSWLTPIRAVQTFTAGVFVASLLSCDSGGTATEIMVVVDSDLTAGTELERVDVALYEPTGQGDVLVERSFAVLAKGAAKGTADKKVYPLPFSFALAPASSSGGGMRAFRMVVSGSGTLAGVTGKVVETQLTSAFQPQKALRLDVFLAASCGGNFCSTDSAGVALTTCVAPGGCAPIPDRTDLPAFEGGPLGGYDTPTLPVADLDGSTPDPRDDAGALIDGGTASDGMVDLDAAPADDGGDATVDLDATLVDGGADGEVDASCPPTGCVCSAGSISNGMMCVDIEECADPTNVAYCTSTGYPCEESLAPGFTCRGHRADWRMPDSVAGAAARPSYTPTGSGDTGYVTDNVTGLEWQARNARERNGGNTTVYTYEAARAFCDALVIGTRNDFRLPSLIELVSILDTTRSVGGAAGLLADGAFTGGAGYYWTQTVDTTTPTLHRLVSFQDGSVPLMTTAMPTSALLRCVRSPTPVASGTPQQRFTPFMISGVREAVGQRDVRTGLTWAVATPAAPFQYASAATYCAMLGQSVGIVTRVPTYKELLTLLNFPGMAPYTDSPFAASSAGAFWTASTPFGDTSRQYTVNFTSGAGAIDAVTNTALVRCVTSSTP